MITKKELRFKDLFNFLEKKVNLREEKRKTTWNCDGKLSFVKEFCKENKLVLEDIEKVLNFTGGFCDCEVLLNSQFLINKEESLEKFKEYKGEIKEILEGATNES